MERNWCNHDLGYGSVCRKPAVTVWCETPSCGRWFARCEEHGGETAARQAVTSHLEDGYCLHRSPGELILLETGTSEGTIHGTFKCEDIANAGCPSTVSGHDPSSWCKDEEWFRRVWLSRCCEGATVVDCHHIDGTQPAAIKAFWTLPLVAPEIEVPIRFRDCGADPLFIATLAPNWGLAGLAALKATTDTSFGGMDVVPLWIYARLVWQIGARIGRVTHKDGTRIEWIDDKELAP